MVSRWAFEAIAVEQFKSNPYQKHFYNIDKQRSDADFQKVYRLPILKEKLLEAANKPLSVSDKAMVIHELSQLFSRFFNDKQWKNQLEKIDVSAEARAEISDLLKLLDGHYTATLQRLNQSSDSLNLTALNSMPDSMMVRKAKEKYTNLNLCKLVKNAGSNEGSIAIINNRIIQLTDPIYQNPKPESWLDYRTQLFFPIKHFMGYFTPTLWFNLFVIWLMTFILYWALYYRIFRWLLNRIGNLPLVPVLFKVRWKRPQL